MTMLSIRDTSLHVRSYGAGYPVAVMHGGPGADLYSMLPLRGLAGRFSVILYDHRCNGRSHGAPVESMTWDNLTADADALRQELGFDRWAVVGHSFGGHVALEYALRYPERLSHLVLLGSGGDSTWSQQNAARLMAKRGFNEKKTELVRRWFSGDFEPDEMVPILLRIGGAYSYRSGLPSLIDTLREALRGGWRMKMQPEALIFAGRYLLRGWTVMDRLGEIAAPTLVIAGRDDFIFPPEHQAELAAGIPNASLEIIERAGHNPHTERAAEVISCIEAFLSDSCVAERRYRR
jgi:proline iminopeptidase